MIAESINPMHAALEYAKRGYPVFPLHSIVNGRCSCGRRVCHSPGKHPRTTSGYKEATTDEVTIRLWWSQSPSANIGMPTGQTTGTVVLDEDPDKGGNEAIAQLEREYGPFPVTATAKTGGGGRHFIFAHPGHEIRNRTGIMPGLDVRGDGGYIVIAPSIHMSGRRYEWIHHLESCELAALPSWLDDLMTKAQLVAPPITQVPSQVRAHDEESSLLERAAKYVAKANGTASGNRNDTAFNLAGHLAAFTTDPSGFRLSSSQAVELMRGWNIRCSPPLSDSELSLVVGSAFAGNGSPRSPHVVSTNGRVKSAKHKATQSDHFEWRPFPTAALPPAIRSFVATSAKAMQCDESFIALPALAVMAAAIGVTRQLELHPGWYEKCILWTGIIGESGTLKTPSIRTALRPMREIQAKALAEHGEWMHLHEQELAQYEKAVSEWNKGKTKTDPPTKPIPPAPTRILVSDTTWEALAPILRDNARGVLLAKDELAGWLGSFDKYTSSRGADVAHWLSTHSGEPVTVDRKSSGTTYVSRAHVCICGGIQPETLKLALGSEHFHNGLASRLLMAMPPRRKRSWSKSGMPPEVAAEYALVIERLRELQPEANGDELEPVSLRLDSQAEEAWAAYYDRHAEEQMQLSGAIASAWCKLEGGAARLALVIHFARWAAGEPVSETHIDSKSMKAGITLADWFKNEVQRVYSILREGRDGTRLRELREWIASRGDQVSPRDVMRGLSIYRNNSNLVQSDLDALVAADCGRWSHPSAGPAGGAPTSIFILGERSDGDETSPGTPAIRGSVAVTNVLPRKETFDREQLLAEGPPAVPIASGHTCAAKIREIDSRESHEDRTTPYR